MYFQGNRAVQSLIVDKGDIPVQLLLHTESAEVDLSGSTYGSIDLKLIAALVQVSYLQRQG